MLALSSTAIVLQTLNEKGWIKQEAGQNAFLRITFSRYCRDPHSGFSPFISI